MIRESLIIAKGGLSQTRPHERGMALLLTLLVTIILAIVVLEFNYLIRVHATLSSHIVDDLRAQAAAEAGLERVKALLLNDVLADAERGFALDVADEDWAQDIELETERSTTEVRVSDEMSKLNLNRLIKGGKSDADIKEKNAAMVESFKHLFESLDLEPDLVDKIVDWIDEDDEEEPYGAESSYYENLDPPIKCKNGPMDSVEELLLIEGFDRDILYGTEDTPGLVEFVTVCGEANGLVNINTAPQEVLAAALNSQSQATMIADMRQTDPFESAEDMTTRLPDLKLAEKFTTGSSFFLVSSRSRLFIGTPDPSETPVRQIELLALLRRVRSGEETEEESFSIDTISWKTNRFEESD